VRIDDDDDMENESEQLPHVDMEEKKTQFARCVQMLMDPESPMGAMPCLAHHSKGLSEAEKKELSDFEPDARTGKAINDLAVVPAVISKAVGTIVDVVSKVVILGGIDNGCSEVRPGEFGDFKAYRKCLVEQRLAFKGQDPDFNKVLKEEKPAWIKSTGETIASWDHQLDLFDKDLQYKYRTIPDIVREGVIGSAELATAALAGPVIRGSVSLVRIAGRGVQITAQAVFNSSRVVYRGLESTILLRNERKVMARVVQVLTSKPVVWSTRGESAIAAYERTLNAVSLLKDYTYGAYNNYMMSFISSLPDGNAHLLQFLKSGIKHEYVTQGSSANSLYFLKNQLGRISYAVKDFMAADLPIGGLKYELQGYQIFKKLDLDNLGIANFEKVGSYRLGVNPTGGLLAMTNVDGVLLADMFSNSSGLSISAFVETLEKPLEKLGAGLAEIYRKSHLSALKPSNKYLAEEGKGLLSLYQDVESYLKKEGVAFLLKEEDVLKVIREFNQNPGVAGAVLEVELSDFIWNPTTFKLIAINPGKLVRSMIDLRWPAGAPIQDYIRLKALIKYHGAKAGLNPRQISILESACERGYQSEFSGQAHTPEALRFYQLRENLRNLIVRFLKDESGTLRLPSMRAPVNAEEISEVAQRIISRTYLPTRAPDLLPAFPDAVKVKSKANVRGGGVARKRWKDKNSIYEWDSRHGYVEKYDLRGKHKGKFDARTGKQIEEANPRKSITP